jgi:hypothetical protein
MKKAVIIEIRLVGAEIRPDKEKEFLMSFDGLGRQIQEALMIKQGLTTQIKVSLK